MLTDWNFKSLNAGCCFGFDHWKLSTNTPIITPMNPATGQPLPQVQSCSISDYETIIAAAQASFLRWRMVPAPKRGEFIRQMGEALRQKKEALSRLISIEMGKVIEEARGEVQEMIDMADFAVGQSRMLYGLTMHSERPAHRMYEQWHPLGVVGVISAFNFPVAVWAWNAFIAAIAGNTVIWKPSSKVPLCALAVQQICNEVMKANGYDAVFSIFVSSDKSLAEQFVQDKRIPLISFTGSTHAGKRVGTLVAERLGRSLLELGGNNAILIDESANLSLAIRAVLFGAVGTAGQRCTTTRRLIVHKQVYDTVLTQLKNAYQTINIGDPLDKKTNMGPLIDGAAVESFEMTMAEIRALGASIICGGKKFARPGYFVEPTIVEARPDWNVVKKETFAPILYVMKYSELHEAIAIQNDTDYGLSSAIFTQNLMHAEDFLSEQGSDCGIANVNIGTSGAEIGGAFGGEKQTGGGREAGSDAWKAYMRRQTCTINWSKALPLAQGISF